MRINRECAQNRILVDKAFKLNAAHKYLLLFILSKCVPYKNLYVLPFSTHTQAYGVGNINIQ